MRNSLYIHLNSISSSLHCDVYLVRKEGSEDICILKSLRKPDPESSSQTATKLRFRKEIDLVSSFDHPNIAKPIDSFAEEDSFSIVYPFRNGKTLARMLEEGMAFSETDSANIILQVLDALEYIHTRSIIHCDINPCNIFIDDEKGSQLIDFGLSLTIEEAERIPEGRIFGTIPYLSPEQMGFTDFKMDTRTDLYCAAIILYRLLAGRLPFTIKNNSLTELLTSTLKREIEPINSCCSTLNAILIKALKPTPSERYQTASGFISDLRYALREIKGEQHIPITVLGEKDAVVAINRSKLFVAREREIAQLEKGLHSLQNGMFAAFVLYGKSGIGKTETVRRFALNIDTDKIFFLPSKCNRFTPHQPYSIFRHIVLEFILHMMKEPEAVRDDFKKLLDTKLGENSGIICQIVPELSEFFTTVKAVDKVDPEKEADRISYILTSLFLALCEARPMTIFIDDLQWIDSITFNAITNILNTKPRCLLVACYRTEGKEEDLFAFGQDLRTMPINRCIPIAPFNQSEIRELILTRFGTTQNCDALAEILFKKTDGNPFIVTEAIRYLVNSSALARNEKGWQYIIESTTKLPEKFDPVSLVLEESSKLDVAEKRYLELASLIEGKFQSELIERFGDFERQQAGAILRRLEMMGLIKGHIKGGYSFAHDKIQESVVNEIPKKQKAELYDRLSSIYEEYTNENKEFIFRAAECRLKAENPEKALDICYNAAVYATEKISFDAAIRYFKTTQFIAQQIESRGNKPSIDSHQISMALGDVLMLTGKNEQALKIFETLSANCPSLEPLKKIEIKYKIGKIYHNMGEFEKAVVHFQEAAKDIGISLPRNKWIILFYLGVAVVTEYIIPKSIIWKFTSEKRDEKSLLFVRILNRLCYSSYFNDMQYSAYLQFKANNKAEKLVDCFEKAEAYAMHAIALYHCMLKHRALKYRDKSILISNLIHKKDSLAFSQSMSSPIYYYRGDWKSSMEAFNASIATCTSIGNVADKILSTEHLWKVNIAQGDFSSAITNINIIIGLCKLSNERYYLLLSKAALLLIGYLNGKKIIYSEINGIDIELSQINSILFHIETGASLIQIEILQNELNAAYKRILTYIPLVKSKCFNSEYQVKIFTLLCDILSIELRNRTKGIRIIDAKADRLSKSFKSNLAILWFSCLNYPAYWGQFYKSLAWYFAFKKLNKLAHHFFKVSIKKNHTLSMRYEEARSQRDYAIFLEEFCNKPGEARDRYNEAYRLFFWCGAKLETDRIEAKVDPWIIQSCLLSKEDAARKQTAPAAPQTSTGSIAGGANQVQVNALYSLATSISTLDNIEELISRILRSMIDATGAQYGSLFIDKDEDHNALDISMDYEGKMLAQPPYIQAILDKVRASRKTLHIRDGSLDRELFINELQQVRSVLCVPLIKGEKYVGCVYLANDKVSGLFTETAQKSAQIMAAQALTVLENAWLMDKYKRLNRDLEGKVHEQTTDIRQKNDQLHDYNLKMVENERMKNLLTGTLVHDIKNFVMCIHGGLQFLETNTAGDPRNSRFVQMGLTACGDITSLASNLMDIQKIEEGKMPLNVEEVDVSAVCELIEKFRENPIFIERELMVITIPPIDRSPMWADMYLLKRVVHNIMSNAGKYAPKAGEVILNFEDGTQEQVISIFSSGEAIEDKYKEILFDKYSQMGQERSQYSKGLGLFFCKTVMLAHGGRIWVESDARGNYFKMAFPRQNSPCSKKPIEKQKAAEQPVPATPQQEPKVETKV